MMNIARRQLAGSLTRGADALRLEKMYQNEALAMIGDTLAGFVVVSRDAAQPAVLALSPQAFCSSEAPEAFRWWLEATSRRLTTGVTLTTRSVAPVDNFVKTHWDQLDPFNGLCPTDGGTRCPTGCVATAMAQVMKYYNYPAQGRGTGFYTVGSSTRQRSVAINSTYDWDNMRASYSKSSGTNQKKAVQQLMYDAGCAVGMNYGKEGSSTSNVYAAIAMFKHFSYDSLAVRYMFSEYYNEEEWAEAIYDELAQKNPILYGGDTSKGGEGHAFLLTGNDAEGRVWINWGWGRGTEVGGYDGFFAIDGMQLESYLFDANNDMVLGFRSHLPVNDDEVRSQWCCDAPYTVKALDDGRLELAIPSFFNYAVLHFQGMLYYLFTNTQTGESQTEVMMDLRRKIVPPFYGYVPDGDEDYMRDTLSVGRLAAGTYELTIASKATGEKTPTAMRTIGGIHKVKLTKGSDGTVSIEGGATAVSAPSNDQRGDDRVFDLYGRRSSGASPGIHIRDGRKFVQK